MGSFPWTHEHGRSLPDPNAPDLDAIWELEWQANLIQVAMKNLKRRVDPRRLQIFDFYVNKEWPPEKVADRFNIPVDQVYQIKHRVTAALRTEVRRLAAGNGLA